MQTFNYLIYWNYKQLISQKDIKPIRTLKRAFKISGKTIRRIIIKERRIEKLALTINKIKGN